MCTHPYKCWRHKRQQSVCLRLFFWCTSGSGCVCWDYWGLALSLSRCVFVNGPLFSWSPTADLLIALFPRRWWHYLPLPISWSLGSMGSASDLSSALAVELSPACSDCPDVGFCFPISFTTVMQATCYAGFLLGQEAYACALVVHCQQAQQVLVSALTWLWEFP